MKKMLLIAMISAPAFAANFESVSESSSIDTSIFEELVSPSLAESSCSTGMIKETYLECKTRPIYSERHVTVCHYQAYNSVGEISYEHNLTRYQCLGPVYIGNHRYDLSKTEWKVKQTVVGTEKYDCQTRERWVCAY
ncbi:hypothetical protein PCIT_a0749 [Pseudoalteromonas citrea]|uniref:DUF3019 domain-containing protein n=2 Tax=Pseudoalteromonas citrea TaxID=43655 RepID=A0AAD4AL83_9GAMM|nr:hypothetical protein [Pseudoalteromonas citrea]KAF7774319.1 hypothetical protein PCIT_a0749 [Pseudoalteromonas citrea]